MKKDRNYKEFIWGNSYYAANIIDDLDKLWRFKNTLKSKIRYKKKLFFTFDDTCNNSRNYKC